MEHLGQHAQNGENVSAGALESTRLTLKSMNQQTLFVYYKVPEQEHQRWLIVVEQMQKEITQKITGRTEGVKRGLEVSLLRRPEVSPEGLETWMEVYQHPSGIDASMVSVINEEVQRVGLPFKRASEFFIPLKP